MTLKLAVRRPDASALDTPLLVAALGPEERPGPELAEVDRRLGGALGRAVERRDFRGGRDETLHLSGGDGGPRRVLLVGLGRPTDRVTAVRRAASLGARQAHRMGVGAMAFHAAALDARGVEQAAVGLTMGAWEFLELKTPPPAEERRAPLAEATLMVADEAAGRAGLAAGEAIGAGYALARRLAMMPGNLCTPQYLADTATDLGQRLGVQVSVMGRRDMEELRMGSFLAVAQGTPQEPKLIVMQHSRGRPGAKPVALVGKGLCFDSGGISIKPAQGMELMKFDMCGAAGVLGAMEAIARLGLPVNVVGLVGSTTNMPSGTAVNPGDVVQSMAGKWIEVINTDAEGRLVLADVLAYARRFDPVAVVDAATLTGACVIALGHTASGVFGNDEALVREVLAAGQRAGEPGWELPLWDDYKDLIKSDVADMKNSGGRPAGSITAALFLKEFTDGVPWVHLDIAGTAYSESDLVALPKGPTGIPVGTFLEFVRGRTS
ncbi:MAG TPA: leucyl aminopeptidase [Gemmatimonadaceae bacterium]|nr:leucyl aminopeptidase [Gemmatimonadaceae bacterium]